MPSSAASSSSRTRPAGSDPVRDPAGRAAPPERAAFIWTLLVTSVVGWIASGILVIERLHVYADANYITSCDISPWVSCGTVFKTPQAALFGFPNPLLGILGFTVVVTLGVVLGTGARVPTWVLGGLAAVSLVAWGFVHWLAFESLYSINALCPWCLVVWAVTAPIALWSLLVVLRLTRGATGGGRVVAAVWSARYLVLLCWYLLVGVLVLERVWDYWSTLV